MTEPTDPLDQIAVIGIACRFPGATDAAELWRNLRDGVESISFFSDEELAAAGVPEEVRGNPNYVRANGVLDGADRFDAEFFGFTPREAELMDPQHRLFLEHAWMACENAGYDPQTFRGRIGVYGGSSTNSYFLSNLLTNPELLTSAGSLQARLSSDKDFLATQVSYKLNLRGPSLTVQSACSTSLVAVHLACQAILDGDCDMALAGGVSVGFPQNEGYTFVEGGISSPDGHCRAFDADAKGTVGGNGVGVVLLKRLADALADGDPVHAVILGTAVNNDGSLKAGFTAPSVESQAEVVADALSMARVDADSIGMVEAHGSGTPLGDPIEIESLTRAFRASTDRQGFCALGSIKTNLGHCDAAAGVAGLIKAVLAVEHGQIPPSLHYQRPNPNADLDASPFYVSTELRDWPEEALPRRASVNSLGMGGTNAHVVVEEPPEREPSSPSRPWQLLLLSARTAPALEAATANLSGWLAARPQLDANGLADAAHTLRVGRKAFRHRRAVVCRDRDQALELLASGDPSRVLTGDAGDVEAQERSVAFLFPGLGDQYPGMGADLYRLEPAFRDAIDRCADLLRSQLGLDLREVLFPEGTAEKPEERSAKPDLRRMLGAAPEPDDEASRRLRRTALAHPAVFAVEYALAQLWMEWGIRPAALIGYSLGEYVAACLAGVLSLEDALRLVAGRARLVDALPAGAMLAVPLPAAELEPLLSSDPELSLAADNGPGLSVAGGTPEAIERLERLLGERGVVCRRLQTEHAFHSAQMEPIVAECGRLAAGIRLSPPSIPFVSNVTGTWITDQEATDPEYWARHLRRTVRFNQGVEAVMAVEGDEPPRILLEVGPGQSLVTLARQHPRRPAGLVAVASMRDRREPGSDLAFLLEALGRLWLAGAAPDWSAFTARETRHRVALPTYPFDRKRFYVEPGKGGGEGRVAQATGALGGAAGERKELEEWFHAPVWERVPPAAAAAEAAGRWLLFLDSSGLGERLAASLEAAGAEVVRAHLAVDGGGFAPRKDGGYELDPRRPDDYGALLRELAAKGTVPDRIVHLWSFGADLASPSPAECEDLGFYSLLWLFQALGENERPERLHVAVVANGLQEVTGGEELRPEKATLLGPCRVFPQETPGVACTVLDVTAPESPPALERLAGRLADRLAAELAVPAQEPLLALRGRHLWARRFRPVRLPQLESRPARLREGGVYLIAGGLRETGVVMAEHLFRSAKARLALLVPRDAPPRARWDEWIGAHDETEDEVRRMRRLLALEAEGCELLVLPYELTRADRVKVAVDRVRERFGALHGVIHAAGEDGAGLLQWKTRDAAQPVLAPKVQGTLALAEAVRGEALDFFVLFGSRASVLGGFGQGDTCAAGSFLDAFAQAASGEKDDKDNKDGKDGGKEIDGLPVVQAIDWDFFRWQPVTASDPGLAEQLRRGLDLYGITARECAEVFDRALASPLPQVVVSTQDLQAQLGAWSAADVLEGLAKTAAPGTAHARPDLATPYAEPESDVERTVAAVWQEAFGIDRVGIHDNFFDLAGNSLLAVQIVSRLATSFGIKLSITSLLESPTVAELAQRIGDELTASLPAEVDQDEMERILREIEALSADEAQERLTGGTA